MKKKKGISLIVLIITVIVIIVLAAVVILTMSKNNPVERAKEATFKEDVRTFQDDLALTVAKEYTDNQGQRDIKINATGEDVKNYIPSFKDKYVNKFTIVDDKLVATSEFTEKEKSWLEDLNISISSGSIQEEWDKTANSKDCFLWEGDTITGFNEEKLSSVTKIKIPSSCKVIRSDYAFNGAEDYRNFVAGIESVEIPNTVTELGYAAFHNFKNLVSIELPESITKIGENSFKDCEKLENIVLDKNLKEIEDDAFSGCKSLRSIIIPENVTSIGDFAFEGCYDLTYITIPSSVEYMGERVFNRTAWYNNKQDGLIYINNILYGYKGNMPENTSINIKEGTKSICGATFDVDYSNNLVNVTIPESVKSIGKRVFKNCSSLTNITYKGTRGQWNSIVKENSWNMYSSIKTITCTDGVITL